MRATFVLPASPTLQWSDALLETMPGKPFRDMEGAQIGHVVGGVRDEDGTIRVTVEFSGISMVAEMFRGDVVRQVSLYPVPAVPYPVPA